MKKSCSCVLALALLAAAGCGSGNLGSTPQETSKFQVDNLKDMKTTLETIKDDATASAALPKLEQAVARQNALKKKMESYNLSMEDAFKVMQNTAGEMANTGMAVAVAELNAVQKAPGKAGEIAAVFQKMSGGGQGSANIALTPNSPSGPIHAGPKKR